MALSSDPSESLIELRAAPVSRPRLGRTVLVVCEDDGRRRQWARVVRDLGFRPVAVASATEGRRLLASLSVRAAIVGHKHDCTAIERASRSLLMVALVKTPTILIDDAPAAMGDVRSASQRLFARGPHRVDDTMVNISSFQVHRHLADGSLHN